MAWSRDWLGWLDAPMATSVEGYCITAQKEIGATTQREAWGASPRHRRRQTTRGRGAEGGYG